MVGSAGEQRAWITRVLGFQGWPAETPATTGAALRGAAVRMAAEVQGAVAAAPRATAALRNGQTDLEAQLAEGNLAGAEATLRKLASVVDALTPAKPPTPEVPPPPAEAARQHWEASRAAAVAPLKAILARVQDFDHPGAMRASLRLRSVIKTLAFDPATQREATELERWVASDDVVENVEKPNGFGIAVSLRTPLLQALGELKPFLGG